MKVIKIYFDNSIPTTLYVAPNKQAAIKWCRDYAGKDYISKEYNNESYLCNQITGDCLILKD